MSCFPDWEKYAVVQKRPQTGCIPWGYEILLRAANTDNIDYDSFQDVFDLNNKGIEANFKNVADEIHKKYPFVNFEVNEFDSGKEKLSFIESLLSKKQPTLISLALSPKGGWHIMPVVDADKDHLLLFNGFQQGRKISLKIEKVNLLKDMMNGQEERILLF